MTLDIRQAEIEDDQRRILRQQLQRGLAVRRLQNFIALRTLSHPQQFTDRRFVVDNQDLDRRRTHAAVSSGRAAAGIGN
jgi:hypothetical protein